MHTGPVQLAATEGVFLMQIKDSKNRNVDPLGDIAVGDLAMVYSGLCAAPSPTSTGEIRCTRPPHPREWKHVACGPTHILAVWVDEDVPCDGG